jgi:N-dimethylarginine dimethylaminohydrolase
VKYIRSVLMGDPAQFRIRGGANPHTRTRWGFRKTVDRALAGRQWHGLARTLLDLGVDVYVVPAIETSPGLVYPANAGFLTEPQEPKPLARKTFYLSRALPTRAAERMVYGGFLKALGFQVQEFPVRFEGEADFFPTADAFLFTSGFLTPQRFVLSAGWPPWKRVYGFRSAAAALDHLQPVVPNREIIPLTLVRETHYHGDTCLCAFGPLKQFLMAYLPALSAASQARLREKFGERLLPLSEEDGEMFSANSFQVEPPGPEGDEVFRLTARPTLVMPATATERLRAQVRERGVDVVTADVSEFMEKGGGSVKCLIGDLGVLAEDASDVSAGARLFRRENRYSRLFPSNKS